MARMGTWIDHFRSKVTQSGSVAPAAGKPASLDGNARQNAGGASVVTAPAHLFGSARTLQLADRTIAFLRSPNPLSRRAKAVVQALFRAEAPAWPIYRLLATERFFRRTLLRHVVRAAYHQPILRTMCARAR